MESKEYQVLQYERIEHDTLGTSTTAEVLELVNGAPKRIFVVPVIGMKSPTVEEE